MSTINNTHTVNIKGGQLYKIFLGAFFRVPYQFTLSSYNEVFVIYFLYKKYKDILPIDSSETLFTGCLTWHQWQTVSLEYIGKIQVLRETVRKNRTQKICDPGLLLMTSVADPWNFGADSDPDLRIHMRSGSCYFRQWPRRQQKIILLLCFFAYYFSNVHLHHLKSHKSQKTVGIKVFLNFFAWW